MPAYVVVQIEVHDPVRYEEYKRAAQDTVALYGGRYVVRTAQFEQLEPGWDPKRFAVLEFPDRERALAWYHSPEYAPARALRHATATSGMILVDGYEGPRP